MATTRQSIINGPGTVTIGSGGSAVKIFDKDGITAEIESSTQEIPSSISGNLDTIKTDQIGRVSLTPVGNLSEALVAALFPSWAQTPVIGQSLLGSSDVPLQVHSRAGTKVVFTAAALTQCPELRLSPVATAFGQAQFTALLPNGKLPTDSTTKFYTVTSATYADGEAPRDALSGFHYTGELGDGVLEIPDTLDGWTVTPELQLEPVTTDSQGTIDYRLTGVTVRASCTPLGLTEAQLLAALPVLKGRGASLAGDDDLVISSTGGLTVTLKHASLVTGPIQWGATQLRAGQIGFIANIDPTTGSLFSVSYTDPD